MPKVGNRRKKRRTHIREPSEEEKNAPLSMVFKRGKPGPNTSHLVDDLRLVLSPYTAKNLKESKKNKLKDFLNVAGPLGVTHFVVLNQSDIGTNIRLMRVPHGPTLTFRVCEFTLIRDIAAMLKRPISPGLDYTKAPLVVLNGFSGKKPEKKLMGAMFQNMFPPVNVKTVKLTQIRRVALFSYSEEKGIVEFRHYVVRQTSVGLTKSIKKVIRKRNPPDLNKYNDISDYVLRDPGAFSSDSEAEDPPDSRIQVPNVLTDLSSSSRGGIGTPSKKRKKKTAVKLKELGPRITLKLLKIEDGINEGKVLYNAYVSKSAQEVEELEKKKMEHKKQKEQQEENVKRKTEEKMEKEKRKLAAKAEAQAQAQAQQEKSEDIASGEESASEDSDAEYYRQEVEEEPEPGMFLKKKKKRRGIQVDTKKHKRKKFNRR